uniref:Uncharacterized protein n=1 Tax=viral metagenome TaxID=1070528 RepID=A0A6M3ITE3_9ZZZZ
MSAYSEKDRLWFLEQLKSEQCLCERSKKPMFSFCYRCYKALPADMQKGLYLQIGDGYEEAYEEAVKYLEENVW